MANRYLHRKKLIVILMLLVVLLISFNKIEMTRAAYDWSWNLTKIAYVDSYRVLLITYAQSGSVPDYVYWYDSQGNMVNGCEGGSICRHYEYYFGSLVYVVDYFYIRDANRQPDVYTVKACGTSSCSLTYYTDTFEVKSRTRYVYIPFILR